MPRFRLPLTRLLALLLLAQWGAAFAPCFAGAARIYDAHSVEICGVDGGGLRTILVDEDGRPVPEPAEHRPTCPDCGGPAALEPSPPMRASAPVVWPARVPVRPADAAGFPVAQPRAPPQQPRAPPTA